MLCRQPVTLVCLVEYKVYTSSVPRGYMYVSHIQAFLVLGRVRFIIYTRAGTMLNRYDPETPSMPMYSLHYRSNSISHHRLGLNHEKTLWAPPMRIVDKAHASDVLCGFVLTKPRHVRQNMPEHFPSV